MNYPIVKMSFQVCVAKDVGTDAAIMYENIVFWCTKNQANETNFYEGRYWTYNTLKAFNKLFSWMSTAQVRNCLNKLEKKGYVVTGNFNKSTYDRTKWYANNKSICEDQQPHLSKSANGSDEIDKPIPDNKPNPNPDDKKEQEEKGVVVKNSVVEKTTIYVEKYNQLWGRTARPTKGKITHMKERLKVFTLDDILKALENLSKSPWHKGENNRGWVADPNFLIRNDEQVDNWMNNNQVQKQPKGNNGGKASGGIVYNPEDGTAKKI